MEFVGDGGAFVYALVLLGTDSDQKRIGMTGLICNDAYLTRHADMLLVSIYTKFAEFRSRLKMSASGAITLRVTCWDDESFQKEIPLGFIVWNIW